MKKLLSFLLIIVLVFSFVSCGGDSSDSQSKVSESVESRARSSVISRVQLNVSLKYEIVGLPTVTCYLNKIRENEFEATGKVTVRDKYGDTYTGKYDAVVEYNPTTDKFSVSPCNVDSLYKD